MARPHRAEGYSARPLIGSENFQIGSGESVLDFNRIQKPLNRPVLIAFDNEFGELTHRRTTGERQQHRIRGGSPKPPDEKPASASVRVGEKGKIPVEDE